MSVHFTNKNNSKEHTSVHSVYFQFITFYVVSTATATN